MASWFAGTAGATEHVGPLRIGPCCWLFQGWKVCQRVGGYCAEAVAGTAPGHPWRATGAPSVAAACAAIAALQQGSMLGLKVRMQVDDSDPPSASTLVTVSQLRLAMLMLMCDPLNLVAQDGYLEFGQVGGRYRPLRIPLAALD